MEMIQVNITLSRIFVSLWPKCLRGSKILFQIVKCLITHQIFYLCPRQNWGIYIRVTFPNFQMPRIAKNIGRLLKKQAQSILNICSDISPSLFFEAHSFPRDSHSEICLFFATDNNAHGQISQYIFAQIEAIVYISSYLKTKS